MSIRNEKPVHRSNRKVAAVLHHESISHGQFAGVLASAMPAIIEARLKKATGLNVLRELRASLSYKTMALKIGD